MKDSIHFFQKIEPDSCSEVKRLPVSQLFEVIILNTAIACLFLSLRAPFWETDDDFFISGITSGMYGTESAYGVFINIILGFLFKTLYTFLPNIHWYLVLYLLFIVLSYTAISYVLYLATSQTSGRIATVLLQLLTRVSFYVTLNFTRVAALSAISGLILAIYSFRGNNKKSALCGCGMMFVSSLYRLDAFLMVAPLAFTLLLILVYKDIHTSSFKMTAVELGKYIGKRITVLGIIALSLVIILLSVVCNFCVERMNPSIRAHKEYLSAIGPLLDYYIPDYETHASEYDALGITANDVVLLASWSYGDTEVFDLKTVQAMSEISPRVVTKEIIKSGIKNSLVLFGTNTYYSMALIISVVYLISIFRKGMWTDYSFLLLYVVVGILVLYLYIKGRVPARVMDPLGCAFLVTILIATIDSADVHFNTMQSTLILIFAILYTGSFWITQAGWWMKYYDTSTNEASRAEYLSKTPKENFYFIDASSSGANIYSTYGTFEIPEKGVYQNLQTLGGWMTKHPCTEQWRGYYGIDNPYRSLVDMQNVFLIANGEEFILSKIKHIEERYYEHVDWSVVDTVGNSLIIDIQASSDLSHQKKNVDLRVYRKPSTIDEERFVCISGQLAYNDLTSDAIFTLRVFDEEGNAHCFGTRCEKNDDFIKFSVEIPKSEFDEGINTVELLCNGSSADKYIWQTEPAVILAE